MKQLSFLQPIQVRLWIAFLAVAVVSVVGAARSVVSDQALSYTIQHFGSVTLPEMMAAQSMLTIKSGLIEETRALAKATDRAELAKRSAAARTPLTALKGVATDRLKSLSGDDASLRSLMEAFETSLSAVEKGAASRIDARDRRVALVQDMEGASKVARSTAEPFARHLREQLAARITALAAAGDTRHLQDLDKNEVAWLITLQRMRSDIDIVAGMLSSAATADNEDTLRGLEAELGVAAPRLSGDGGLPDTPFTVVFTSGKDALLGFVSGSDSIIEARSRELKALQDVESAVAASARASDDLATALSQFADRRSVASGEAIEAAAEQIRTAKLVQGVLAVLALATAGLIGWLYVKRNLVRRMLGLRDAMRAVATGHLDTPISVAGRDELAAMAEALVIFRDNAREIAQLQQQRDAERRRAEEDRRQALFTMAQALETGAGRLLAGVAAAATQLQQTAQEMSGTAEMATDETERVADATQQASVKVDGTAHAAQEMSVCIQEVARHVTGSTQASTHARDEAQSAHQTVAKLQEAAGRVGDIVTLIRNIAQKTHLLALNATIEAARAGEAGKGFVVVAGEVNALANQTATATGDIERQVAAMQAATGETVASIGTILGSIENANDLNTSAAAALEEQSRTTSEIAHSMSDTAELIVSVQSGMKTVTDSVQASEQAAAALTTAATQLSRDTEALGAEVDRFIRQIRQG